MVLYLVYYDSLLQNAADIITKYDSFYKIRRLLNQKVNLAQSDSKNRISLNLLKPNIKTDFK